MTSANGEVEKRVIGNEILENDLFAFKTPKKKKLTEKFTKNVMRYCRRSFGFSGK